jgi:hypothetical protein
MFFKKSCSPPAKYRRSNLSDFSDVALGLKHPEPFGLGSDGFLAPWRARRFRRFPVEKKSLARAVE